jgi:hypothetical protein
MATASNGTRIASSTGSQTIRHQKGPGYLDTSFRGGDNHAARPQDHSWATSNKSLSEDRNMTENPYKSPAPGEGAIGVNSGSREDLRGVAKAQRGIMLSILAQIGLYVANYFAVGLALRIILALVIVAVGITAAVFVFMLALRVYSTGVGILLGILALVPCLGLIILLIVNGKATNILRQNGIAVGLLGADPSTV